MKGSITVLNIGGMNDDVQQETQRVDQDVPFATFDLFMVVKAFQPPFSVVATDWVSIMANDGLSSRPSRRRDSRVRAALAASHNPVRFHSLK